MNRKKTWLVVGTMLAVAVLGFVDATYLTVEHYRGAILNCTLIGNCQYVTTSEYALIAGIPVALLGSLYYATMILFLVSYLDRRHQKTLNIATWFSVAGFVASVYFIWLQAFVLETWCQYCLVSAATSTLLFLIAMGYHISKQRYALDITV